MLEARTAKFTSFFALSSSSAQKIVSQVIRSYLLITRNAEIFSSARKTVRRETTNEQFTPSTSSVILNLPCVYIAPFSTNLSSCYICAQCILGKAPPIRLPPPQKSLQLSLSEVNSEKRLREEGEGESPRFYQVSKTVRRLPIYTPQKEGGRGTTSKVFHT